MDFLSPDDAPSILLIGFLMGCAVTSGGSAIAKLQTIVNWFLVPLYAIASAAYLLHIFYQKRKIDSEESFEILRLRRCISGRGFDQLADVDGIEKCSRADVSNSATVPPAVDDVNRTFVRTEGFQPVNLTGTYKLVKNEGFDEFLAAQGVPWALRRAVDRAHPVHHIVHEGDDIRIKITGIITSESTFRIGGPPVETQIRSRVFLDTVTYTESGDGIRVHKDNRKERYKIIVTRQLTSDRNYMIMRSRAVFDDGVKESVEAKQTFVRAQ